VADQIIQSVVKKRKISLLDLDESELSDFWRDAGAVGGGENHQCGENDLGITRDDNYQQVEKHTISVAPPSRSNTPTYASSLGGPSAALCNPSSSVALGAPPSGGTSTSATFGSPPGAQLAKQMGKRLLLALSVVGDTT
jgi:hypothetical protein